MNQEKQIEQWVREGTITDVQAEKMLADVRVSQKDEKSNKLIIAVSTIGVLFFGIGAMLFIATNWQAISDPVKILLAFIVTFGSYYVGYLFKYQKKNLPKVGASLLFLGAILFGGTIMLIAEIYNINANAHALVLVWLIGILPLVYALKSKAVAVLSSILFLIWVGSFIFQNVSMSEFIFLKLPVIYVLAGVLLFSIGGAHYFLDGFSEIARILRLIGIKVAMFSLFLLTFRMFSGVYDDYWMSPSRGGFSSLAQSVVVGIVFFLIITILGLVINIFFNPAKSKNNLLENATTLSVLLFTMLFFFFPSTTNVYNFLFNMIFAGLTGFLIYIGYERSDIALVNTGVAWLSVFVFAKYFDLFWGRMEISLFFLVGGVILVLGGIALERKRRQIKEQFNKVNA